MSVRAQNKQTLYRKKKKLNGKFLKCARQSRTISVPRRNVMAFNINTKLKLLLHNTPHHTPMNVNLRRRLSESLIQKIKDIWKTIFDNANVSNKLVWHKIRINYTNINKKINEILRYI